MAKALRFRDWSLRTKLAVVLIVASTVPLCVGAAVDIREQAQGLENTASSVLTACGDELRKETDAFNRGYGTADGRMARIPEVIEACRGRTTGSALKRTLAAYPESDAHIRGAALADREGRIFASSVPSAIGRNIRVRPYFRTALSGSPVISDVYIGKWQVEGDPTIAYAAPVLAADGSPCAVAILWVRAEALWALVREANGLAGNGSFAEVMDENGVRIGHTYDASYVFHPTGALDPNIVRAAVAEQKYGPQTAALLSEVKPFPEAFDLAHAPNPSSAPFKDVAAVIGKPVLGVARRFETVPWTVVYVVPEANLTAQTQRMARRTALLAAILIVLALGGGALFGSGILRPVQELGVAAERLEHGDMSARVESLSQDELGRLGGQFNAMAQKLEALGIELTHERDALEIRVTERTSELQASEALLRGVIDNSPAIIYVKDLLGRYVMVNRRFAEVFQISQPDCIGKSNAELLGSVDTAHFLDIDARVVAEGIPTTTEEVVGLPDGTHTFIAVKCPLRDSDGKITGIFGISTDISDRKISEIKLRAQLERLDLLNQITQAIGERQDLRSIFQVVIRRLEEQLPLDFACVCLYDSVDASLTVTSVGVRSEGLALDLAMSEQARIPIDQNGLSRCVRGSLVYEPDVRDIQFDFPQRLARGGLASLVAAPLQVESAVFGILVVARSAPNAFTSADCEFLKQLSQHVALAAHQAELTGALQQAYDDLRLTQQAVMQQERLRALGQMASGIAHDINNSISPISLYTEALLATEAGLSPKAREYLETIARAIDDVAATVSRMREFYRHREASIETRPVNLNQLVQEVVDLTRARWRDMALERGTAVSVELELHPDLPAIQGVESELREMLTNLVFNAVDAMPDGGKITLKTSEASAGTERQVRLVVTDTGVGMDEETRRRCLEPFFTTKGERGTGLGLAMVYGVAQRHGADLEIESAPTQGTSIQISFPVQSASTVTPSIGEVADVSGRRYRILLIDDDPLILKSLRDILEGAGHVITTANGGQAGIDAFLQMKGQGQAYPVVITDLGMPSVDGRKVAAAIRQSDPEVTIILLTGWGQRLTEEGDVPPHVDCVLNKPPKLRDINAALARIPLRERAG